MFQSLALLPNNQSEPLTSSSAELSLVHPSILFLDGDVNVVHAPSLATLAPQSGKLSPEETCFLAHADGMRPKAQLSQGTWPSRMRIKANGI